MLELSNRISEAVAAIRKLTDLPVDTGLILGSGLGMLADEVENPTVISFSDIPHFPPSTVVGHAGALYIGTLEGQNVAAFKGRVHYYEGYNMQQVTFPVRLMKGLGATRMVVTNAAGGVNEKLRAGDLVLIKDHLNFTGSNPLIGPNDESMGPRFPDMVNAYDKDLRAMALEIAREVGVTPHEGVYLALSGPSYETPAEVAWVRMIGGDMVGMSTVPEVIVARHMSMKVLGISCITNALHGGYKDVSHEEVLQTAREVGPKFIRMVRTILQRMPRVAGEGVTHASR